jgi:hypothetical protein
VSSGLKVEVGMVLRLEQPQQKAVVVVAPANGQRVMKLVVLMRVTHVLQRRARQRSVKRGRLNRNERRG